jgi:hypothetical protein
VAGARGKGGASSGAQQPTARALHTRRPRDLTHDTRPHSVRPAAAAPAFPRPPQKKDTKYNSQLVSMMARLGTRFIVDVNDLRTANRALADHVVHDPATFLPILEATLREVREGRHGG